MKLNQVVILDKTNDPKMSAFGYPVVDSLEAYAKHVKLNTVVAALVHLDGLNATECLWLDELNRLHDESLTCFGLYDPSNKDGRIRFQNLMEPGNENIYFLPKTHSKKQIEHKISFFLKRKTLKKSAHTNLKRTSRANTVGFEKGQNNSPAPPQLTTGHFSAGHFSAITPKSVAQQPNSETKQERAAPSRVRFSKACLNGMLFLSVISGFHTLVQGKFQDPHVTTDQVSFSYWPPLAVSPENAKKGLDVDKAAAAVSDLWKKDSGPEIAKPTAGSQQREVVPLEATEFGVDLIFDQNMDALSLLSEEKEAQEQSVPLPMASRSLCDSGRNSASAPLEQKAGQIVQSKQRAVDVAENTRMLNPVDKRLGLVAGERTSPQLRQRQIAADQRMIKDILKQARQRMKDKKYLPVEAQSALSSLNQIIEISGNSKVSYQLARDIMSRILSDALDAITQKDGEALMTAIENIRGVKAYFHSVPIQVQDHGPYQSTVGRYYKRIITDNPIIIVPAQMARSEVEQFYDALDGFKRQLVSLCDHCGAASDTTNRG